MEGKRGMSRTESSAISARFRMNEIERVNKFCNELNIPRSILIHDAVMQYIEQNLEG